MAEIEQLKKSVEEDVDYIVSKNSTIEQIKEEENKIHTQIAAANSYLTKQNILTILISSTRTPIRDILQKYMNRELKEDDMHNTLTQIDGWYTEFFANQYKKLNDKRRPSLRMDYDMKLAQQLREGTSRSRK